MTTVTRDNGGKTDSLFTMEDLLLFHVLMVKVSNALCLLEFFLCYRGVLECVVRV